MPHRTPPVGQSGRTMVEVLVASAASVVVLLTVTVLMAISLRWSRADREIIQHQRAIRNAADRIARDVRQAGAVRWNDGLQVTRNGASHRYKVENNQLKLIAADGTVTLLIQPVTSLTADIDSWTNVVNLTLESVRSDGTSFSVSQQITPRVVVP